MDKEKIILAAIKLKDGTVVAGNSHADAFAIATKMNNIPYDRIIQNEHGFITSQYRYVDRKEGGQIAFEAGQTSELQDLLFSEDITGNYPWASDQIASLKREILRLKKQSMGAQEFK